MKAGIPYHHAISSQLRPTACFYCRIPLDDWGNVLFYLLKSSVMFDHKENKVEHLAFQDKLCEVRMIFYSVKMSPGWVKRCLSGTNALFMVIFLFRLNELLQNKVPGHSG